MDYKAYITSKAWRQLRKRYEEKYPKRCYICDSQERIHLHHKTYKRLGKERPRDLVWLCEECHAIVHQIVCQRYHGTLTLWSVAKRYKKIYRKRGREGATKWSRQWAECKKRAQGRNWSKEIAQAERELRKAHAGLI